ncbi:MAG: hypothetical protein KDJ38_08840 [Gammaproteobacteria bacterium]|nr:hypothetical protein [Gammaproteobacteria bacterium]
MNERSSIEIMLQEIRNYGGDFGDSIVDYIDFDPLQVDISDDAQLAIGAGIALLVEFCSHIDNSTYLDALAGKGADNNRSALSKCTLQRFPSIIDAMKAALESESVFNNALKKVYRDYVAHA